MATILFDNTKSLINYKTNKNFFEFTYYNDLEKQKFLYNAKLNFKPSKFRRYGSARKLYNFDIANAEEY